MLHAVVIGIDKYKDEHISNLRHAVDDAESIAGRIEQGIHPEYRRVTILLDSQATTVGIRTAVGEVLPRVAQSKDDVILMYFAGHGSPETSGAPDEASRYLVAHDTKFDNVYATGIDLEDEVTKWFRRIARPNLILFFIDACFSGRGGGRTFEGPRLKKARGGHRSGSLQLNELELGAGRAILTACDDDQVARESTELGHGIFTHELLEVLSTDSADRTISVPQLYDRVREGVLVRTSGRQDPVLNGRIVGARMPLLPDVT